MKCQAFEKMLLSEYQSIICKTFSFHSRNVHSCSVVSLHGRFCAEGPFREPAKASEYEEPNFPLFSFLAVMINGSCILSFWEGEIPLNKYSYQGKTFHSPKMIARAKFTALRPLY